MYAYEIRCILRDCIQDVKWKQIGDVGGGRERNLTENKFHEYTYPTRPRQWNCCLKKKSKKSKKKISANEMTIEMDSGLKDPSYNSNTSLYGTGYTGSVGFVI